MAKKVTQQNNKPNHLFWYVFPGQEPSRIKEGEVPVPPFKRFDTAGECHGYIMTEVKGYCTAARSIKEDACPKRFSCQLYSNFFALSASGAFKGQYMGDVFKNAPFGVDSNKEFECKYFKEKEAW